MVGFADWTPEQRRVFRKKAQATRLAKRAKAVGGTGVLEPDAEEVSEPAKLPTPEDELDIFAGLLSEAEKAEIDAAAAKRAREDERKRIKVAYAKEALDRARRKLGSMPADEAHQKWIEEPVRIYIDVPRLRKPTGGEHPPDPIILDQQVYTAGRFYEVPRGKAIYLNYLMDQMRRHINQVDGRSRTYYNPTSGQMIYQGGPAAGGGSLGTSFDALHKRSS